MIRTNHHIGGWILVGILIILFSPVTNIHFAPDSITYLQEAVRILTRFEYEDPYRGPGFPSVIAFALGLTGPGSLLVIALPRIAYSFALVCFTGLAWRMYGYGPAFVGFMYLALAPVFFIAGSKFHVDIFVIAWSLLALWLNYIAYDRLSRNCAILSGLVLAVAFLNKEIVVVLIPLWIMAWIAFSPYTRKHFQLMAWSIGSFVLAILPWILVVSLKTDPGSVLGKNVATSGKFSAFKYKVLSSPLEFLAGIPSDIVEFWKEYFIVSFDTAKIEGMGLYGALAVLAFLVIAIYACLRRKQSDIYVLLVVASFLPLMLYFADQHVRLRQSAIIFSAYALAVSGLVRIIANLVRTGVRLIGRVRSGLYEPSAAVSDSIALTVGLALVVGLGMSSPSVRILFGAEFFGVGLANWDVPWFSPTGKYKEQIIRAGLWLKPRLADGQRIMTAYRRNAKLLETIYGPGTVVGNAVARHNLEHWRLAYKEGGISHAVRESRIIKNKWDDQPERLLFLWHNRDKKWRQCLGLMSLKRVPDHFCKMYFITERRLLEKIKKLSVGYIIIGEQMAFQRGYFDQSSSFELVKKFEGKVATSSRKVKLKKETVFVYKVVGHDPIPNFKPVVSYQVPSMLREYRRQLPEEFNVWKDQVVLGVMGTSGKQYESIKAGEVECFRFQAAESKSVKCEVQLEN